MNHFASICRSLKSDNQEARDKKAIRAIEEKNPEAGKRYSLDCGEYAEYTRFKQNQSYGLFALAGGESSRTNDGPRASIEINKTKLSFLIDTGAPINVIDESTYHSIHMRPKLEKCHTEYYGYTARSPLQIVGQFVAELSTASKTVKAGFIVIKGRAELLLGYKTATALGLVTIINTVAEHKTSERRTEKEFREKLKKQFPKLFSESIGATPESRSNWTLTRTSNQSSKSSDQLPFICRTRSGRSWRNRFRREFWRRSIPPWDQRPGFRTW
jgi:hypothetical protein